MNVEYMLETTIKNFAKNPDLQNFYNLCHLSYWVNGMREYVANEIDICRRNPTSDRNCYIFAIAGRFFESQYYCEQFLKSNKNEKSIFKLQLFLLIKLLFRGQFLDELKNKNYNLCDCEEKELSWMVSFVYGDKLNEEHYRQELQRIGDYNSFFDCIHRSKPLS